MYALPSYNLSEDLALPENTGDSPVVLRVAVLVSYAKRNTNLVRGQEVTVVIEFSH